MHQRSRGLMLIPPIHRRQRASARCRRDFFFFFCSIKTHDVQRSLTKTLFATYIAARRVTRAHRYTTCTTVSRGGAFGSVLSKARAVDRGFSHFFPRKSVNYYNAQTNCCDLRIIFCVTAVVIYVVCAPATDHVLITR